MNHTTPLRRRLPQSQVVAVAAVVIGLTAAAGSMCAGDANVRAWPLAPAAL
jgi:hypothetical protein